jgi:hypothetical protein
MRGEIARHQCARRDANRRINLWRREELITKTDAEEIGIAILFFGGVPSLGVGVGMVWGVCASLIAVGLALLSMEICHERG